MNHFFILNKYWIKEILKMNNESDLNPDVLVAFNNLKNYYIYLIICVNLVNELASPHH